jgi:hypothetical protein
MNSTKRLAATVAGAAAIAMFVGTSAFAEARHHDGTGHSQQSDHHSNNSGSHDRSSNHQSQTNNHTYERRDYRGSAPAQTYRGTAPQTWERRDTRNFDRSNTQFDRRVTQPDTSSRNNRSWDSNRTFDRSQTFRNNNNGTFDRSQNFRSNRPAFDERGRRHDSINGRISRFDHERGGYRIWLDGGRFPVWIPEARIGLFPRLRVGLSLNFGGYYDPLGYLEAYDYYDGDAYGISAYGGGSYSSGILRGVVETVDYRRGTLVLRDEASGNFVTTIIRDRRLEDLRPGDYAEISGDWTRNGVFEGLRLEDERGGY